VETFADYLAWGRLQSGDDLPGLADLLTQPHWMADSLCREYPTVDFHPARGGDLRPAKAVCARCLVRQECLEYAVDEHIADGVWGGVAPAARQRLRRLAA
jgi:WhiB family transcriptional regulator, redox-sensing transcriptional regulator